jgi:hypothetical protein
MIVIASRDAKSRLWLINPILRQERESVLGGFFGSFTWPGYKSLPIAQRNRVVQVRGLGHGEVIIESIHRDNRQSCFRTSPKG